MRLHTSTLTEQDITDAARLAGVTLYRNSRHGSRRRSHAFDVILEGSGRTGTRYGQNTDMIAATWDEWGIFLAELFRRDETLTIPRIYEDAEHFDWATAGRFRSLDVQAQHIRHKWVRTGTSITGSYEVSECRCGATQRWLWGGHDWRDIAA